MKKKFVIQVLFNGSNETVYLLIDATSSGRTYLRDKRLEVVEADESREKAITSAYVYKYKTLFLFMLVVLRLYKTTVDNGKLSISW